MQLTTQAWPIDRARLGATCASACTHVRAASALRTVDAIQTSFQLVCECALRVAAE